MWLIACNFTKNNTPQKLLSTDFAGGVIFLQCEIICKNTPFLVKKIKNLHKNTLFQNALKILEQPDGGVPKNSRPVNLEKAIASFGC